MSLHVKLLSEDAVLPVRGSPFSAGLDLFAAQACVVPRHGKAMVQVSTEGAAQEHCFFSLLDTDGLGHCRSCWPLRPHRSALVACVETPH